MAQHGAEKLLLFCCGHGAERVGERGADASLIDPLLCVGTEAGGEAVAARDPSLAAPEQVCGRRDRQAVVAHERVDDARLVHRRQGAWGCVGAKQQGLALRCAVGVFDDDRDVTGALAEPPGQPLEAIEEFEGAVVLRDDPQRHLSKGLGRGGAPADGTQRSEAPAQTLDRQAQHRPCSRQRTDLGRRARRFDPHRRHRTGR